MEVGFSGLRQCLSESSYSRLLCCWCSCGRSESNKKEFTQPLKWHRHCWHKALQSFNDLKTFISYRGGCKQSIGGSFSRRHGGILREEKELLISKEGRMPFDLLQLISTRWLSVVDLQMKPFVASKISYWICCCLTAFFLRCSNSTWEGLIRLPFSLAHMLVDSHKHRHPYSNMSSLIWPPVLQQLHDVR